MYFMVMIMDTKYEVEVVVCERCDTPIPWSVATPLSSIYIRGPTSYLNKYLCLRCCDILKLTIDATLALKAQEKS